jgi:hypothetical protein
VLFGRSQRLQTWILPQGEPQPGDEYNGNWKSKELRYIPLVYKGREHLNKGEWRASADAFRMGEGPAAACTLYHRMHECAHEFCV